MMKKLISLSLCLILILSVFAGCAAEKDENDYGAYVNMYLSDPIYNFDPAMAYGNDSALKVISLLFDNLFVLNDDGKVEKSLAKKYTIDKEKNQMVITLNSTCWSDGNALTAEDVVFAWRRILDNSNSSGAAALLFDIKNAKAAKENANGITVDDVGISANGNTVTIEFEDRAEGIDYDRFILNLTSYALVPLSESSVNRAVETIDWAKKPSLFVTSGPFKIREVSYSEDAPGLVLERNSYYYRNADLDKIDESVTPYRLIVDYSKSDEEIMQAYQDGKLFFMGDIPLSVRASWKDQVTLTDAMSTHTYVLNQNSIIRYYDAAGFEKLSANKSSYNKRLTEADGERIFANQDVRKALSLVINREAIAEKVVFAQAATALVAPGVFNESKTAGLFGKIKTFRSEGSDYLSTSATQENLNEAKSLIANSGIDPDKFMFAIAVPEYDDVQVAIAEEVQKAWSALGFHVAVNAIKVIDNTDDDKTTKSDITGIKDDIFHENYLNGYYDVAAIDYVAYSADPFSVLAPFAQGYTGESSGGNEVTEAPLHASGYRNDTYTDLIDKAYKTTNLSERASLLHQAEEILMSDLPVIPILYNQSATLASKNISKYEFTYYGTPIFTKLKLKNYLLYVPSDDEE